MSTEAIIVLCVIIGAVILFVTEALPIDLVGILIPVALIATGVLSPEEGVAGFSNSATLTVAFMFVISAALLKTGALQQIGPRLSPLFQRNYRLGLAFLMAFVAFASAFVNNTPIVAVFIPVVIQLAHSSHISPSKLLIPLSYASIFGGTCSLIGTSTNILVSGIAVNNGLPELSMFVMAPIGLIFVLFGILYMIFIGNKFLPNRHEEESVSRRFGISEFLTEIELLETAEAVGKRLMDSTLVRELKMEVLEVRRNGTKFPVPAGDLRLQVGDVLKVSCDVKRIKQLKDRLNVDIKQSIKISGLSPEEGSTSLLELVIPTNSPLDGKTLKQSDFRRKYRASALAIRHREEVLHDDITEVPLKAGDVILAEVKSHYLQNLMKMTNGQNSPFILLSEEGIPAFNKKLFWQVLAIVAAVVTSATLGWVPILVGTMTAVTVLVLLKNLTMKEVYQSIQWKVVFLLAGALSLGLAMEKTGLADLIAHGLVKELGPWGPVAVLSGLYLVTSLLTEMMSNNATAALLAPIAISTARAMDLNPLPFLLAIMFAASASFMTPVGYQTNTMIYGAGQYRFRDFMRTGVGLNILFWLIATLLIPIFYHF